LPLYVKEQDVEQLVDDFGHGDELFNVLFFEVERQRNLGAFLLNTGQFLQ